MYIITYLVGYRNSIIKSSIYKYIWSIHTCTFSDTYINHNPWKQYNFIQFRPFLGKITLDLEPKLGFPLAVSSVETDLIFKENISLYKSVQLPYGLCSKKVCWQDHWNLQEDLSRIIQVYTSCGLEPEKSSSKEWVLRFFGYLHFHTYPTSFPSCFYSYIQLYSRSCLQRHIALCRAQVGCGQSHCS